MHLRDGRGGCCAKNHFSHYSFLYLLSIFLFLFLFAPTLKGEVTKKEKFHSLPIFNHCRFNINNSIYINLLFCHYFCLLRHKNTAKIALWVAITWCYHNVIPNGILPLSQAKVYDLLPAKP